MQAMDKSTIEWLISLQKSTEPECLSTLSSKCVVTSEHSYELLAIRNSHLTITQIRAESDRIIEAIDHFIDNCLPITRWQKLERIHNDCLLKVFDKIQSVVEICRRKGCDYSKSNINKKSLSSDVMECCQLFSRFVKSFVTKCVVNNPQLEATLRKLKEQFGELVDQTIKNECRLITQSLKEQNSYLCIKWSLLAYLQLTRNDAYLCRVLIESKQQFIHLLIDLILNYCSVDLSEAQQIRGAALTVVTNICSNRPEAVSKLMDECINNKSFIQDLLLNESSEFVLRQAIQLCVQLTKHFIDCDDNNNYQTSDEWQRNRLTKDLINCLTELIKNQSIKEKHTFLMVCTVLANISFLQKTNVTFIKCQTIVFLLASIKTNQSFAKDVLIKDQVITILANIGRKYPEEVVACNGLVFVLCALQMRPIVSLQNIPELLTIERIQQKCCVCLARLSNDRSIARLIERLNGVQRLVQLSKDAKERNFSDTVLLASIVCIRKICQTIGKTVFRHLEALDLIEPKVNETFLLYSEKNETIVWKMSSKFHLNLWFTEEERKKTIELVI